MAFNPQPLTRLDNNYFKLNVMLLGPQNSGKTCFSCGSQFLRTLHLDIDSYGSIAAKAFPGNVQMGIPPIRQDLCLSEPVNTVQDMYAAITWIERNYKQIDLVVVDTITDFQRIAINSMLNDGLNRLSEYDYGPILNLMQGITERLKRVPVHVIYNAHETDKKRVVDGYAKFTPAFDGQFLDVYQGHFSEIWRYVVTNQYYTDQSGIAMVYKHRMIQCQTDESFDAKNRTAILDKYETPYLDHIFTKIMTHVQSNGIQQ